MRVCHREIHRRGAFLKLPKMQRELSDVFVTQQHVIPYVPVPFCYTNRAQSPFSNSCLLPRSHVYQGNKFIIALKLFVDLYHVGR